jgi:hypothetical protein
MAPTLAALGLQQLAPASFVAGIGLFGALMFLNALCDTAWALVRPRRRVCHVTPLTEPIPPPYVALSARVLPLAPWEGRPPSRMPRVYQRALASAPPV